MPTKITILCDNYTEFTGLIAENGFGVFIETNDKTYLFDTGAGFSLSYNALALKKDFSKINKIFLSHGHKDHTGGLLWAIDNSLPVNIIAHPNVFDPHSVKKSSEDEIKQIGCPLSRRAINEKGAILNTFDKTTEIDEGLYFITGVERRKELTPADPRLILPGTSDGTYVKDTILDDASLLISAHHQPVLLLGCAHSGLLNILNHLEKEMGITRLKAIIGGTHLKYSDSYLLDQTIERLKAFSVDLIAPCHCTGFEVTMVLAHHFKETFHKVSVGNVYLFQ
jgi:7,8-dihydropterin-6-yl-methyl-4-(beta-D-ribofuranosyl)aminobenzene 5'-phosphate synthase